MSKGALSLFYRCRAINATTSASRARESLTELAPLPISCTVL